jgi:hypothetical protein
MKGFVSPSPLSFWISSGFFTRAHFYKTKTDNVTPLTCIRMLLPNLHTIFAILTIESVQNIREERVHVGRTVGTHQINREDEIVALATKSSVAYTCYIYIYISAPCVAPPQNPQRTPDEFHSSLDQLSVAMQLFVSHTSGGIYYVSPVNRPFGIKSCSLPPISIRKLC